MRSLSDPLPAGPRPQSLAPLLGTPTVTRLALGDDRDRILSPAQRRTAILRLLASGRYDAFQLARLLDCSVGAAQQDCLDLMVDGLLLPTGGHAQHVTWALRQDP